MILRQKAKTLALAQFPRAITIQTRYADLDPLRHINNAKLAEILGEARTLFIQQLFQGHERPAGLAFMVGQVAISYVRQAHYPQDCVIGCGVMEILPKALRLGQALCQADACCAIAESVLIATRDGRPAVIPDPVRALFADDILSPDTLPRQLY